MQQCQNCKSPATVHLTDLVKNDVTHLCAECAAQQNPVPQKAVQLHALLSGLFGGTQAAVTAPGSDPVVCPYCGTTYAEFRRVGRFGCSEDYDAFARQLDPLIKRVQGDGEHVGKRPLRWTRSRTRNELEERLRRAVGDENYEEAARLRDLLGDLKAS
jgi:protein arginine kinase activator